LLDCKTIVINRNHVVLDTRLPCNIYMNDLFASKRKRRHLIVETVFK